MSLIEVKDLKIGYEGHTVLDKVNFSIDDGEFVIVVGSNGAGKTTLIKALLGLVKPVSGSITFNSLKQEFIGYMPQETKVDSNFPASVYEIVLSGTLNKTLFYTKKEKKLALDNLKLLGISNLKDKSFQELSGGQRQKVLLARSLCSTEKLLILDEPSNNLDIESKKDLYKIITELNTKHNITIIMITHDLDHDNLIGNKIIQITDGTVISSSTEEFVRRVHHE
ncbi:MAG: ATP-binding cassette domain-containing protein [Bacilli bacterium]|nr:ATP-binding cassette domain-containing protein [Bacilli bacterium]